MEKLSVIIPAFNEEENIAPLLEKFDQMLQKNSIPCEVILVDDGSTDKTYEKGVQYQKKYNFLKVVRHQRNLGKTEAILSGFKASSGTLLVIMDADLQYFPISIPKLFRKLEEGFDVVTGWKRGKYEKRLVSSVYNYLSRWLFKIPIHDQNAIKLLKREVLEDIQLRKDWHRYIIALACDKGYKVGEVKVDLYPRKYGKSKYGGVGRVIIGILDMIAIKFQISFMRKPLLFFGSIGGGLLLAALVVGIIALYLRFGLERGYRPLLYLVTFLGISGLLLFVVGFLAEAIAGIQDEIRKLKRK